MTAVMGTLAALFDAARTGQRPVGRHRDGRRRAGPHGAAAGGAAPARPGAAAGRGQPDRRTGLLRPLRHGRRAPARGGRAGAQVLAGPVRAHRRGPTWRRCIAAAMPPPRPRCASELAAVVRRAAAGPLGSAVCRVARLRDAGAAPRRGPGPPALPGPRHGRWTVRRARTARLRREDERLRARHAARRAPPRASTPTRCWPRPVMAARPLRRCVPAAPWPDPGLPTAPARRRPPAIVAARSPDTMTSNQHTVAIQQVQHILLGARHRGLALEPLLLRAGIAPALLDAPLARISQRQYAALIRVLRRQLRDELWGLMSRPLPPGSFGRCMRQLVRCATLGEALREGFAYYHLLLDDFVPRLHGAGRHCPGAVRAAPAGRAAARLRRQGLHADHLQHRLLAGGAAHSAARRRLHRRATAAPTPRGSTRCR